MKRTIAALLLGMFIVVGCQQPTQSEGEKRYLPPAAKNIKELGSGWYEYDLEVGGRTRKFLMRVNNYGYQGHNELLVELQP